MIIKKCTVTMFTDSVTVVEFDNHKVQLPFNKDIHALTDKILVKFDNDVYSFATEKEWGKYLKTLEEKKDVKTHSKSKKETRDEEINEIKMNVEIDE